MTLIPKFFKYSAPLNKADCGQNGQVTIFFAVLTIVIMGLIAFVINVGLFVKAKINFQNAVDAAAYSGAAVQARQLTNIAYLNWELHNTYKEWMFKYYVLGQASLNHTLSGAAGNGTFDTFNNPNMNFRGRVFNGATDTWDPYNLPTVCIHPAGNNVNICEIYDVPGVPRFAPMGIPGMDDEQTAFVDAITSQKGKDCARRSETNFSTLLQWVYGVEDGGNSIPGAPQVASGRMGAWPQALEIALRMRNLEMFVNRPPVKDGICVTGSCEITLDELMNQSQLPVNERPVKAFQSAWKSLGGADSSGNVNELKSNLILYELGAAEAQVDFSSGKNLSNFLIPTMSNNPAVPNPMAKYYLDLKIMPINYVNFFTAFVSTGGDYSGIQTDAECKGSKSAMPIPGYIFGFAKNQDILTYYAVKAETKYVGLLFPFTQQAGIPMKAYAAAKPFGGRIGPLTFDTTEAGRIKARGSEHGDQLKSGPFISGLDVSTTGGSFKPGYPIPLANNFWVATPGEVIGGIPDASNPSKFGVPNILYDIIPGQMGNQAKPDLNKLQIIKIAGSFSEAYSAAPPAIGLYNKEQFKYISKSFQSIITSPDAASVNRAVDQSRHPTRYDALNYMIPTIAANDGGDQYDSPPAISDLGLRAPGVYNYNLYAPLFHSQALYPNEVDVTAVLQEYINNNRSAVETFLEAYFDVAQNIRSRGSTYEDAAKGIHDGTSATTATCKSIAGKFEIFFSGSAGSGDNCGIIDLKERVKKYWADKRSAGGNFSMYYRGIYALPTAEADGAGTGISNSTLMTAYAPGKNHNATGGDDITYPYTGTTYKARRNSYSTKFVPMARLMSSSAPYPSSYLSAALPTTHDFSEPKLSTRAGLPKPVDFKNSIPTSEMSDFSFIPH